MAEFVLRGRTEELSRAVSALRHAAETGQGGLIVLAGEPGIGKSAVLRAIVEHASRTGFTVGSGKAEQGDQIAAGAALLVSLRSGPHPLLAGDAFTGLAQLYDKPLWLVDRISALLEELAGGAPVLIAIDDLHWADRLTRFALRVLPARLAGSPVVWAVTSRWVPNEPLEEVVAGVHEASTVTRISLGALTSEDIDAIATDRTGAEPSAPIRKFLGAVRGNPFWAVQVVDGAARRKERGQALGDLCAELSAGVYGRLAGLSSSAIELIRLIAVWGRPLRVSDAVRLLGHVSSARVGSLVREGVDNGLLGEADGEVYFAHDLVRETVYADIPPADRRAIHRTCARDATGNGTSALAAAAHYRASAVQDDEEAILALEQAARECMISMPPQAAELAQQAFALTSETNPLWLRAGTQTVEILINVQRETTALSIANRLLVNAVEPDAIARIELYACQALWYTGDAVQMQTRAENAMARVGVSAVLRAQLSATRALAATRTQSGSSATALARSALAEGRRLEDVPSQRLATVALIEAARHEGRHQLALELFPELRGLSDSAYQAEEIRTLQHLDRYDDAEAMLAKIREAQDDVDKLLPSMLYAQMWQDYNLARFDAAEAGARTLLRLADEIRSDAFRLNACMVLAAVATYRGEPAAAEAGEMLIGGREPAGGEVAEDLRGASLRLMSGWLRATAEHPKGISMASGPLLGGPQDFRDPWPWSPLWMRVLARIGLEGGNREFAHKVADVADRVAQRNPGVATLSGTAIHIRAILADDPVLLADAVRILRESPRPLVVADALKDLGTMLLAQRPSDEAVDALVEAAGIYQRVGAVSSSRDIANLLRSQGIRGVRIIQSTPRPPNGWAAMTPTELRVVELISAGHSNRSAAIELSVSPNTISTHLRAVFRKLDVRSRVQLTIAYRERSAERPPL